MSSFQFAFSAYFKDASLNLLSSSMLQAISSQNFRFLRENFNLSEMVSFQWLAAKSSTNFPTRSFTRLRLNLLTSSEVELVD